MKAAELLARLARPDLAEPGFGDDPHAAPPGRLTPAAVLIAIRPAAGADGGGVVLTRRTEGLRNHAGQVSFPGGRIDAGDRDAEAAALREAAEEIGLPSDAVHLAGRLPDYVTGTGFSVTPVLGLLTRPVLYAPAPAEVAAVFELPLPVLLDPAAPERREALHQGRLRHYWVWPHAEHFIWGATAAMLVRLAARLRG